MPPRSALFSGRAALGLAAALVAVFAAPAADRAQQPAPNALAALRFRTVGPLGNRADAVAGEPGNPLVAYVGAASGGIFKTDDGGVTWRPIFDGEDVAAIGALALAPGAPNIVWAGTGEPFQIRPFVSMGDGVYKSTDAGATWHHMGLDLTGHIARIVIDPRNPDVTYVCAVGQLYKPHRERGVYKTMDGGRSWTEALFVNDDTGCSDLAMDPRDPQTLYAGMWQVSIHTWNLQSGGPGSGLYVTHDAGATWTKLAGHGLPEAGATVGKVAVAVAPGNPGRLYALIEESTPTLYTSGDRGETWTIVNRSHILAERAPYYVRVAVSPDDENRLYFPAVSWSVSFDGGRTLATGLGSPGGDNHDVWIDPLNPSRLMVANDGGASISYNKGKDYQRVVLPTAQMYHVAADDRIPYRVYGNRQDGPTFGGPSDNLTGNLGRPGGFGGGITAGDWTQMGGCESGFAIPQPDNPNLVWSGCFDGLLTKIDQRTGQSRNISPWPDPTYGWAPADVKYRWNWSAPLVFSPHDPKRAYYGSQYVHETTDGGQSWRVISPDLTTNDKSHQRDSGGVALDNPPGTYDGSILYAIAESPVQAGLIWTGSNDGQVNVTRDGGKTWTNVTKNVPSLKPWGTVWQVTPSKYDAGTAYVTYNLQHVGDYDAHVYKTADFGKTWTDIGLGVPKSMNSSAHTIIEDPVRKGMLFLGTDNAIYVTWDDGGHWTRLRNNMPPAPVYWLTIQPRYDDLVIGTYGRGIWILDDISPLREIDRAQTSDVTLFKPRSAYRYRHVDNQRARDPNSQVIGGNPPGAADIDFYLKAPDDHVRLTVQTAAGKTVRTLEVPGRAGLNRVWWDLRWDLPEIVKIRTSPPGEPWVTTGPDGWRPLASYGAFRGNVLAATGTYTVALTAAGRKLSQPLQVLRDPASMGTDQDIKAETDFLLQLRTEMGETAGVINHLEWVRRQLQDLQQRLGEEGGQEAAIKAAAALEKQATDLELKVHDVYLTGRSEDSFRHPMRLYDKICYVGSLLNGNWGGTGADLPPTQGETDVHGELAQQLAAFRPLYRRFIDTVVPAFNESARGGRISPDEP